ncbi:MAG TPA: multiheme c-type cytochrome [Pyrinomonadaceae bacterium]|nr:multiheme c-type cytochrome [Pyrinomonadaceae bacterium]
MAQRVKKTLLLISLVVFTFGLWLLPSSRGQNQRDPFSRWRPTHALNGVRYVGSGACAQCHVQQTTKRLANSMSRALAPVDTCEILKTHPRLNFRNGPYNYQIAREGNRSVYTITNGLNSISEPVLYCFGQGKAGQTYVFQHKGVFYESRVSYYQEIQGLDFTIVHPRSVPESLEDGLGRPMTMEAAQGCFACHSTAAVSDAQLQLDRLMPGITCEGCHGPGEKHSAAIKAGSRNLQVFNPAKLDPDELSQEFCGACHVSFEKALLMPKQGGANNLRYQPYRIFNSRGHSGDARISCVACHDPHDKLAEGAAFYDSKCLACHLATRSQAKTTARSAPACPVSKQQCTTCHMPKIDLPGAHGKFTDHWIRIVKAGEPTPN